MSLAASLAHAELEYRNQILGETWGHLAPEKNKTYTGYIVFTWASYGDLVIIDAHWDGLEDSPWLYDAMQKFVFDQHLKAVGIVEGGVYRFEGTLKNYRFKGKKTPIYLPKST